MIGSLFGLGPFIEGLNYIWRMWFLTADYYPNPEGLKVLDAYMAAHQNFNWFSLFFPPTFPRYQNGARVS